jgi:Ni/Fe-hydrogenase subunit HybB-like protein
VELAVLNLIVIVFEMQSMKIMLTSRDKNENDRKQKINSILKYTILITSFISIVVSLVLIFYKKEDARGFLNVSEENNMYIWIMYIFRNVLFVGIAVLFLRLFKFFFIIKKAKLAKEGKQFTG